MTSKRQIIEALEKLPDEANIEDAMDQLYLLYKIERGMQEIDRGEGIPHEELKKQVSGWFR